MELLQNFCADAHTGRLLNMLIIIAVWLALSTAIAAAPDEREFLGYRHHGILQVINRILFIAGCVTCLFVRLQGLTIYEPLNWLTDIIIALIFFNLVRIVLLFILNLIKGLFFWVFKR